MLRVWLFWYDTAAVIQCSLMGMSRNEQCQRTFSVNSSSFQAPTRVDVPDAPMTCIKSANAGTDRPSIREAPDASIDPHARNHPHRSRQSQLAHSLVAFCISHLFHLLAKIVQHGEVSDLDTLRPHENATLWLALEITRPGHGTVVLPSGFV
jgi:hypothetical protein